MAFQRQPAATRGFERAEYVARLASVQAGMQASDIDVLLLNTEPEVRYFSGFTTQFWQSPTRPWYLLVPRQGELIAVIPAIGEMLMKQTWVGDIRCWSSPDPIDDGVTLLADALQGCTSKSARIGILKGTETSLRMPLNDYETLLKLTRGCEYVDATSLVQSLRQVKSPAEIEKIRTSALAASHAFSQVPDILHTGMAERQIFQTFKHSCLNAGVDDVSYLVGAARADGYDDIIAPPSDRTICDGDVLILDTGCVYDGYFCDFDRNFAFTGVDGKTADAYKRVHESIDEALLMVKSGVTCAELCETMNRILGSSDNMVGRMGHGLGMQLTESPSITSFDETVLCDGMVMTLEPGLAYGDGKVMVHEENLVVRDNGYELLSIRAAAEIPII